MLYLWNEVGDHQFFFAFLTQVLVTHYLTAVKNWKKSISWKIFVQTPLKGEVYCTICICIVCVLSTNLHLVTCLSPTSTETNHKIMRLELNFTSNLKCLSEGNNPSAQGEIHLLMTASFTYQVQGSPLKRPAKKMFAKCTNIAPTACLEVSKNL